MVTLAVAQTRSGDNIATNIETLIRLCESAVDIGCAAVCFPEAFLTGYDPEKAHLIAIDKESAQINTVKNNGEFLVVIEGLFNHNKDGKSEWEAIYKVDLVDFKNLRELTDLHEKMIYVYDNIYTQYEPIDVSYCGLTVKSI